MTNTSFIAKATLALSIAVSGATIATPVLAGSDLPTAQVSLAGIDMNSPAGQKTLERRIHVAATKVCPAGEGSGLGVIMAQQACYKKAVAEARAQVREYRSDSNEQVAALYSPVTR